MAIWNRTAGVSIDSAEALIREVAAEFARLFGLLQRQVENGHSIDESNRFADMDLVELVEMTPERSASSSEARAILKRKPQLPGTTASSASATDGETHDVNSNTQLVRAWIDANSGLVSLKAFLNSSHALQVVCHRIESCSI